MRSKRILIGITILLIAAAAVWWGWPGTAHRTDWSSAVTPPAADAAEGGLKAGDIDPQTGKKIKYWVAPMDPTYIRNEPGKSPMGMDLVPVYEEAGGMKEPASTIRIDPVTIQNMGIRTASVMRLPITKIIRTFGNVTYDETRMVSINTKFDGWIEKLHVNFVGEKVRRGQPLFAIYSPELVTAQEEYLLALDARRSLRDSDFESVRASSQRLLRATRKRLQYWDMHASQIERLEKTGQVRKAITIFSPTAGVVTRKNALEGQFVKAGENQYEIADLSTIWVDVDIYEYELPYIKEGMPAQMELPYIPGERFYGEVLYIYPYLSKATRTVRLRLAFPNPELRLKPDMYANIRLEAELAGGPSLVIPQEAVIDTGVRRIVFVSLGQGRFEPREIKIGVEVNGHQYQVLKGLDEGEEIVISAQFMLDSESRLREAVQKMLEGQRPTEEAAGADDELDMRGLSMDDDLDMSGLSMDDDDLDMRELTMDGAGPPPSQTGGGRNNNPPAERPAAPMTGPSDDRKNH